jgi:RNA polymerase sigma-70 factor (sigma-E family)
VPGLEAVSHGDPSAAGAGDASFEAFVAGASGRLFTMALLLTGHQRAEAEDLLQDALERTYRRWRRICLTGLPEPYVRRILVNAAVDRWRRVRRHREEPLTGESPHGSTSDHAAALADRDLLLRALSELPPRQRAVLVLRYYVDLSEAQTAATLGVSVGSVKSQASRGLARLREITSSPAGRGAHLTPGRRQSWMTSNAGSGRR